MFSKKCPRCGEPLKDLPGDFVLLSALDVPASGSRTEIMVSPGRTMRIQAARCINAACGHLDLRCGFPGFSGPGSE